MKKYKNQILLQAYLDNAKSEEAKKDLLQIEKNYQSARIQHEQELHTQDKNFYQGLKDGLHAPYQEQEYLDYKDDTRMRLSDGYLSQGKEAFDHHHPEQAIQEQELEAVEQQKETETAKSLNDGYLFEKYETELAEQFRDSAKGITQEEGVTHDFMKGQELSMEEKRAQTMDEYQENTLEMSTDKEEELQIDIDKEQDIEIEEEKDEQELSVDNEGEDIVMDEDSKHFDADLDIESDQDLSSDKDTTPDVDPSPSMGDD